KRGSPVVRWPEGPSGERPCLYPCPPTRRPPARRLFLQRPSLCILPRFSGRRLGNPRLSNRAAIEPGGRQRSNQRQSEHVVRDAEARITVEDDGGWEDGEQADDQDP